MCVRHRAASTQRLSAAGRLASALCLGLVTLTSAHARPALYPQIPSLARHSARQERTLRAPEVYSRLRVGSCEAYLTRAQDRSSGRRSALDQLLDERAKLHCSGKAHAGADEAIPDHAPTGSSTRPHQETSARDASALAILKARWERAAREGDAERAWQLAAQVLKLAIPERTRERVTLSLNRSALEALEMGPTLDSPPSPTDALRELRELAGEARGEQVRAEALALLIRYSPLRADQDWAYRSLWHTLPQTESAKQLSNPPPSADWFSRGEAAFKARNYRLTLEAMRRASPLSAEVESAYFPNDPITQTAEGSFSPEEAQKAALRIAVSLMRLRVYDGEAERQLKRALSGSDRSTELSGVFYLANLYGRLKKWDESIALFKRYVKEGPRGYRTRESRYQIGRTLHQAGRYDEAIRAHRALLRTRPKDRAMYQWFLGWSYFRKGDCRGAMKVWREIERNKNLIVGPKARYWTARCLALGGDSPQALKVLKRLTQEAPLGYYALLAEGFKAELTQRPFRWKNPVRSSRARHWRAAAPQLPTREIKRLTRARSTQRIAEQTRSALKLVGAGEEGLARAETRGVCRGKASKKVRGQVGTRGLRRLCDALRYYTGDHGTLWKRQAKRRVAWLSGIHKRKPAERVGAYPLAYYDLSVAAAEAEEITPWWLMAHMLQESRYRPEVVSHAQAIGLMQILGRTGERIHARLKWPQGSFFSDQLYDPALSIRYAAWYLHHLSEDLGHPLLAVGAYNGGPMRFADHQDAFKGQRFDVMVEELGAHESRNYLRKVTDHFVRYLALYASDDEWREWTQRLAPPRLTPVPKRTVGF